MPEGNTVAMTADRLRAARAWQAVHRSIIQPATTAKPSTTGNVAVGQQGVDWPAPVRFNTPTSDVSRTVATLLSGTSRVLMAGRLADADGATRVATLIAQAAQLVAQLARTREAIEGAKEAHRRAARACEAAASGASDQAARVKGLWQSTSGRTVPAGGVETVAGGPAAQLVAPKVEPETGAER